MNGSWKYSGSSAIPTFSLTNHDELICRTIDCHCVSKPGSEAFDDFLNMFKLNQENSPFIKIIGSFSRAWEISRTNSLLLNNKPTFLLALRILIYLKQEILCILFWILVKLIILSQSSSLITFSTFEFNHWKWTTSKKKNNFKFWLFE